jgi:hypothetical protein
MCDEVEKLKVLVDVLKPAKEFSVVSEGENYVTLSSVPWRIHEMLRSLRPTPSDSRFVEQVKSSFRLAVKDRLGYILSKVSL